jgi:dolichyl-phosphate-mannose-protein mannosyltransferase
MLSVWVAAAIACLLGAADPPTSGSHASTGLEALDLVRGLTTAALAITLLLGPGIIWRAMSERRVGLAFLPLPGLGLLVVTAGLAWVLAGSVEPRLICFAVFAPLLGLLLGGLLGAGPEDMLDGEEQRALLITSLALGVAVARSLWSLGPVGELYEGTISRTLVPEGRPDSRIPFLIPEMVTNGGHPYGEAASALFAPYNFSSRGPLGGLATTPVVLLTGGSPELTVPETPWQPFDPQGFMAFRLAMMTFSCTVFLSLWELVRRISGNRAARLALLLGISTPFFMADLLFTWPKLLAASFVLLAGLCIVERRSFRSGLLAGLGYLAHPSALLGLSAVGLLSLWPLKEASWRRPHLKAAVLLVAGVAVSLVGWRLVNGSHFLQEGFLEYVFQAYPETHPSLHAWIDFRANSLGNTFVPMFLPLVHGHDISINTVGGISPGVVHVFFQYWTSVPFGFGILFFPFLLISLWRAARRWPWPVIAVVVVPAVSFTVYWGASLSGMLREGMQSWALTLLAVVALQQAASGFPWLHSTTVRAILALRGLEVLAVAVGATLGTRHFRLLSDQFVFSDAVAVAAIVAFSMAIVAVVWSETGAGLGEDRRVAEKG